MDAAERDDARYPATRTHDHLASDLLTQDAIRRADIVFPLRSHGRRLETETALTDGAGRIVDDGVVGGTAVLE